MFTDETRIKLGDTELVVRRLTVGEIRSERVSFAASKAVDERASKLIREHVRTVDGKTIDPDELSLPQQQKIITELVGFPEGSGISDFIGLLC